MVRPIIQVDGVNYSRDERREREHSAPGEGVVVVEEEEAAEKEGRGEPIDR